MAVPARISSLVTSGNGLAVAFEFWEALPLVGVMGLNVLISVLPYEYPMSTSQSSTLGISVALSPACTVWYVSTLLETQSKSTGSITVVPLTSPFREPGRWSISSYTSPAATDSHLSGFHVTSSPADQFSAFCSPRVEL